MRFIDWFAGIGGFRLGLERAGMECVGSCEIEKKPREFYERQFGEAPTFGDIREVEPEAVPDADLWCGGFPCQGLSVAGARRGLDDPRSGLWWEWMCLVERCRPRWLLIENVPGFLSCSQGADFGITVASLEYIGYGLSWRILDAQFFGLAQRRERVFIVGYLGEQCPGEILFESEGRQGDTPKGGKAGEEVAGTLGSHATGGWGNDLDNQGAFVVGAVSAKWAKGTGGPSGDEAQNLVTSYALNGTQGQTVAGCFEENQRSELRIRDSLPTVCEWGGRNKPWLYHENVCSPADSNGMREATGVPGRMDVSMWCDCPDSARYRALGNAVAVPVIEWIGKRIMRLTGD